MNKTEQSRGSQSDKQKLNYKKIKKLGHGTYGSVTHVYDPIKKCDFAIKKIKFISTDQGIPVNALRQVVILKTLDHVNIVKLMDVVYKWDWEKIYLVLEFVPLTLHRHYSLNFPLPPNSIKLIIHQILKALRYMETKGVIHRDLKPQNILITDQSIIKICDFGQSKQISFKEKNLTIDIATLWYKAPQILLEAPSYDFAVDVWAVGCIMAELIQGFPLIKSYSEIGQIMLIMKGLGTPDINEHPELKEWKHLSNKFPKFQPNTFDVQYATKIEKDLIQKMLTFNPSQRITASDALKHCYFDGL